MENRSTKQLGDRSEFGVGLLGEAFPEGGGNCEGGEICEAAAELARLKFLEEIDYSITIRRLRIVIYSPGVSVGKSILHSNVSAYPLT